jgi:hypothetical protein
MPREAARYFGEIVAIRAERLQDISEEDAFAEGVDWREYIKANDYAPGMRRAAFRDYWDACYRKPEHQWAANEWVWVREIRRVG